jgi:hypothetical protein
VAWHARARAFENYSQGARADVLTLSHVHSIDNVQLVTSTPDRQTDDRTCGTPRQEIKLSRRAPKPRHA